MQMWLVLFLSHYKWYQSNLVTPYDIEALHNMDPNKDVRDLSGEVVIPHKDSHTLRRWIAHTE
jgi:hypothetical protein